MTTIIVGHGNSIIGLGRGAKIDEFDTVIRFPRQHWHPKPHADHGDKTTWIVCAAHLAKHVLRCGTEPSSGVLMFERPRRDGFGYAKRVLGGMNLVLCEGFLAWHEKFGSMPSPSRGLAAVWIARHVLGAQQVFLAGCDNLLAGTNEGYVAEGGNVYTADSRWHDYQKEREWMDKIPIEVIPWT